MASYELETIENGERVTVVIDADSVEEVEVGARAAGLEPLRVTPIDVIQSEVTPQDAPVPPRARDRAWSIGPPPETPRMVPLRRLGSAGSFIMMIVGGMFVAISSIFILIGLGTLLAGNGEGIFFVLFPMIHFSVGAGLLFFSLRSIRNRRDLVASGVASVATIRTTGKDHNVRVNGRHPYKITWRFEHDNQSFRGSRSSMNEELARLQPEDELWVLYDPTDPTKNMEWPPM